MSVKFFWGTSTKTSCPNLNKINGKNTTKVHWFSNINEKHNCKFIYFDMKEFFPFILEETLNKVINFAEYYTTICQENSQIITHCGKSLL